MVSRDRNRLDQERTGSRTHIDSEIEIYRSADQRIMLSESMRTISDSHSSQMESFRKMHDNQTIIQMSANQLHSIISENTARTHQASLDTLLDVVSLGYRQAESQKIILICCLAIIAYLAYLLGVSKGENNFLQNTVPSRLDIETPVKLSDSTSAASNSPTCNLQTDGISTQLDKILHNMFFKRAFFLLVAFIKPIFFLAIKILERAFFLLVARAFLKPIFLLAIGIQLRILYVLVVSSKKLPLTQLEAWIITSFFALKYGILIMAQMVWQWTSVSVFLDLIWLLYIRRSRNSLAASPSKKSYGAAKQKS